MSAIIEIQKLTKVFGGVTAVSGLDCAIKRGELLGVIGPNGSGKTTLVNLMTGFVTEEHPNGQCTVFVPTGPNVTTGFVFHLSRDNVYPVNVSADQAIRTVISCGVGSDKLIKAYSEQASQT